MKFTGAITSWLLIRFSFPALHLGTRPESRRPSSLKALQSHVRISRASAAAAYQSGGRGTGAAPARRRISGTRTRPISQIFHFVMKVSRGNGRRRRCGINPHLGKIGRSRRLVRVCSRDSVWSVFWAWTSPRSGRSNGTFCQTAHLQRGH